MEDKKTKAGSVAVGICLFIIAVLLVVIVMGYYNSNNQKNELEKTKNQMEQTIAEKDKKIDELEDKISKVSDVLKEDENTTNNANQNISDDEILKMAKTAIEKYQELEKYLESNNIGALSYLLYDLGLEAKENLDELIDPTKPEEYIKTNVKYDDFKREILKYISNELFQKEFGHYKNIDGYVGVQSVAAGFPHSTVSKVELDLKKGNEYIFKVTYRDEEEYWHYLNENDSKTIKESDCYIQGKVKCKYVNERIVVSEDLGILE